MPDVITLAGQFKRALMARENAATVRLVKAYQQLYGRVQAEADALVAELSAMDDLPKEGQLLRMAHYKKLLAAIKTELTQYQAFAGTEMRMAGSLAVQVGEAEARAMVTAAAGNAKVAFSLNRLNPAAIERLLGFLDPDGPLYKRLGLLKDYTAEQVSQAIVEGVGLGRNPKVIAKGITDAFGMGLTESMRMMRTVQIYAYREANRASYHANSDVVQGWVWNADLAQACPACVAMHGTVHGLDETLDDHHNGHCAMLPLVIGAKNPITESGADWFAKQEEGYQRQALGDAKYEAWKDGKFELSQLAGQRTDAVYGSMRTETSLKDLLSGGGGSPSVQPSITPAFVAKSIEEAEQLAGMLIGAKIDYSGLDVDTANLINKVLLEKIKDEKSMSAIKYIGPTNIARKLAGLKGKGSDVLMAVYSSGNNIFVGLDKNALSNINATIQKLESTGKILNATPEGLIRHEWAHIFDTAHTRGMWDAPSTRLSDLLISQLEKAGTNEWSYLRALRENLGEYCEKNADEFFAEAYRGHRANLIPDQYKWISEFLEEVGI